MPTWTTPKTNWVGTDYFTATDWLRIVGNAEYIADAISYSGFTPYTAVTDGVTLLTPSRRNYVVKAINTMYKRLYISRERGYVAPRTDYGSPWNSRDLNIIESMLLNMKEQIDGTVSNTVEYYSDEIICGDTISVGLL